MAYREQNPIPTGDSKYLTINVVSRRAKELARTRKTSIPYNDDLFDPVEVSIEEFYKEKLRIQSRDEVTGEIEDFQGMD